MPDQVPPSGPDGPRSPFANKWFIASGAFLGSVLLLGSWVALTGGDEQKTASSSPAQVPTAGAPASTPAGAPPTSRSPTDDAACPTLPDTDQNPLNSSNTFAGSELTWTNFHNYQLPESARSGPAVHAADVARCYAHTPRGAVLALAQTSIRSSNSDNWRPVIAAQVAPGPERDAYLQFVTAARVNPAAPSPLAATTGEYAGIQVVSYTSDTAVVNFAIRFPTGLYRTIVLTAVWQGGDWKQKMTAEGQQSSAMSQQRTLTGYIPFGPGSS